MREYISESLESITLGYFTRELRWLENKTHDFIARVRNEFKDLSKNLYTFCRFIRGRKPGVGQ